MWLIVDNDETASTIISNKAYAAVINGCVTLTGNKHTVGSLTVGNNTNGSSLSGKRTGNFPSQLELQIQYSELKNSYGQLIYEYKDEEAYILREEGRSEQLHEGEEIKVKLLGLETQIGDITQMLGGQKEVAPKAQRELAIVKGKLLDAETYRDHLKQDVASLTGSKSGDENVLLMAVEQDRLQLKELMQKREDMERQAAVLTASKYEVESDVSRLEGTLAFIDESADILRTKAHESEIKIAALHNKLLQFENNANVERVNLAHCVALNEEEEEKESFISERKEESMEKKKEIDGSLQGALTSCGCRTSKEPGCVLEPSSIQNDITRELRKAEKAMVEWVGEEIFESMVLEPQRYLKEARAALVDAREKVSALGVQAQQLQNALAVSMAGIGRPNVKIESDNDAMASESRGKQKEQKQSRRQVDRKMVAEKMRETLLRKSSLLATVKLKYEQIQQSIKALEAGANGVDETIADLHMSTYSSLRGKCKRYFADLVPGKLIDLIPVTPDILEDGLKFVLLSTDDHDRDADGEGIQETTVKKSKRSGIQASHRSTDELSGGQMALLGLSFVFAAALHKRSPLYLLDEVDAALDESNQKTIGAVIAKIFERSQVVCVSHHTGFQEQAKTSIHVMMRDGNSIIDCSKAA
mmetsp:Transcript_609/g.698  ORF Transcript_609/g.698 Transcript_609/m.698 type:complete len:644 (-) Transcript_609:505-2436(-)